MNPFARELLGICREFGCFERQAVCCGQVTVPQCLVLQELLEGGRDNSSLAAVAGVTPSAMTRLVDGLERNGWATRVRGEDDRRRVVVALTAAGEVEAGRLRALTERAVDAVLERIPAARHVAVLEAMGDVRRAMGEARTDLGGGC